MQNRMQPLPWRAKGLSDSADGSTAFNGAMASLSNLIPDPTTAQLWQCRPAATEKAVTPLASGGFSSGFSLGFATVKTGTVGKISALKIVGNIAYFLMGGTDG